MNAKSRQRRKKKSLRNTKPGPHLQLEDINACKAKMKSFIDAKLKEWDYFTKDEYLVYWKGLQKEIDTTTDGARKKELKAHLKDFLKQRADIIKQLEIEFSLSSEGILMGAKYNPEAKKYILLAEMQVQDQKSPERPRKNQKELVVDDETWLDEIITDKKFIQKINDLGFKIRGFRESSLQFQGVQTVRKESK